MPFIYSEIIRIATFSAVGVVNTLFDILVWRSLVWLFERKLSTIANLREKLAINHYAIAQIIATFLAACLSFVLNSSLTFADSDQKTDVWQISRFFIVTAISMVISTTCIQVLTESNWIITKVQKYPLLHKHWPLCAKILTIGVTMVTNFIGYRLFVF